MSVLDTLKSAAGVSGEVRDLSFQDIWDQGLDLNLLGSRKAGVTVSVDSAAALTAVYASWRIISDGVATLPRDAMRRIDGVPKPFRPRPSWLDFPAEYEPWIDFISQVMVSLLSDGNAFVLVEWNRLPGRYEVGRLVVLDPNQCDHKVAGLVEVRNRDTQTVQTLPEMANPYMKPTAPRAMVEVMHLKGMTRPGTLMGMSPIQSCAEALGVSIAAQRYGGSFFENDGTPGGIIEVPAEAKLSPTGQKALRQAWRDLFSGPDRAKNVAVLVDGAKYTALQVNPNEAQFLETRKFGVQEVARIYGVPPHLVSDTTNSTGWGTGMAEQNTAYVIHTLRPWIERVEGRFTALLQLEVMFSQANPSVSQAFVHLNEEALLRGAFAERWNVYRSNVTAGIMTADEVRRIEGFDPLPDGAGAVPWIPLAQAPQGSDPEADEEGDSDE